MEGILVPTTGMRILLLLSMQPGFLLGQQHVHRALTTARSCLSLRLPSPLPVAVEVRWTVNEMIPSFLSA